MTGASCFVLDLQWFCERRIFPCFVGFDSLSASGNLQWTSRKALRKGNFVTYEAEERDALCLKEKASLNFLQSNW